MAYQELLALMAALVVGRCAAGSCANTNSLETELVRLSVEDEVRDFEEEEVASLQDGLLAYYRMEGDCSDTIGNRDGVKVGTVTFETTGGAGSSSMYVEDGGICSVASFANYQWGQDFGVCAWFRRTGKVGDYMGIVSNGYHHLGSFEIRVGREGCAGGTCNKLGGGVITQVSSVAWDVGGVEMDMHEWHHVCLTYDGSSLHFYLDGSSVQQSSRDSGDMIARNKALQIGGADQEKFYGNLDNVRVYGRAITSREVDLIYTNELFEVTGRRVPTPAPSEAQAIGDPHITNLIGRSFDVNQPGEYTLARVPKEGAAVLKVDSLIESIGNACSMFITEVNITGALLSGDSIRVRASRQNSYKSDHQEPAPFSLQLAPGMPWIALSSFPEGDEVHMKGYSMGNTSVEIKAKRDVDTVGSGSHCGDLGVNGFFIVNIVVPNQPLHTQIKLSKRRAWLNVHMARLAKLGYSEVGGILGTTEPDEKWSEPTAACERHMAGADRPEQLNLLHLDGAIHEEGQIASVTD